MGKKRERPRPFAEKIKGLRGIDSRRYTRRFPWWLEWTAYYLGRSAFLECLEYLGKLGILIALITWFYPGCQDRKQAVADSTKSRHYVAWQTINSALGKPGNSGRNDALQDLVQDGVRLDGISLTGGAVIIGPLNLSNARMSYADFSGGKYERVNFSNAELDFANWKSAYCMNCDFQGSSFWASQFGNSTFVWCDFSNALFQTQFEHDRSEFRICNFTGAAFAMGIFNTVEFFGCNLANADLRNVMIGVNGYTNTGDIFFDCNFFGAKATPDIIKYASHQLLTFTNITDLEQWRHWVTNGPAKNDQRGGPQFMNWASNQFAIFNKTNDTQAWLNWSRQNLQQ